MSITRYGRELSSKEFDRLIDHKDEILAEGRYAVVLEAWGGDDDPGFGDGGYGTVLFIDARTEPELDADYITIRNEFNEILEH